MINTDFADRDWKSLDSLKRRQAQAYLSHRGFTRQLTNDVSLRAILSRVASGKSTIEDASRLAQALGMKFYAEA